jgi:hypothetical protein
MLATVIVPLVVPAPEAHATGSSQVVTQSGKIQCLVSSTGEGTGAKGPVVICAARGTFDSPGVGFLQAPLTTYGTHYHAAVVEANGNFSFQDGGNLGSDRGAIRMTYGQTYNLEGWTIVASPEGTRFTNDKTGHGMFVSIENVYAF